MEEEDKISPEQEIDFCTMGMFIIGKNSFSSGQSAYSFFQALPTRPKVTVTMQYFAVACQDDRQL